MRLNKEKAYRIYHHRKGSIAFFTSERSELISHPSASLDISLEQSENIAFKRKLEYIARAERVYTDLT